MLAIGTKPEYFNAVWVKNEWSRFLKLSKNNDKTLIPCFKEKDAYDLPEEFSHSQALDMTKIGFINDVIRSIRRLLANDEIIEKSDNEIVPLSFNSNAMLRRVELLIEDKDFDKADNLCEQILNNDPENSKAYVFKLLIEYNCSNLDELREDLEESLNDNKNYKK